MKHLILIATMMIAITSQAVQAAGCEPGENEVSVYQHVDYKGDCSVLGIGKYHNSDEMRIANDSISSIKVGKNAQITVCNNAVGHITNTLTTWKKREPGCVTLKSSWTRLAFFAGVLYHDAISSATVAPLTLGDVQAPGDCYPGDSGSEIAIYQHTQLRGACRILGVGSYANSNQMNFKNDSISSIEIGRNAKVYAVVCNDADFKDQCETIRATDISLKDNVVGNDKITSIKVLRVN